MTPPQVPPSDPISRLNLRGAALAGARALLAKHPSVVFTSGKRSPRDQARAMSQNVAKRRGWIRATYRDSAAIRTLQAWVNTHPEAITPAAIEAGLYAVMLTLPPAALAGISRHLSGDAFDVQPIRGVAGEAVKRTIRALPGLHAFLEREGGLERWHAQFIPPASSSSSAEQLAA